MTDIPEATKKRLLALLCFLQNCNAERLTSKDLGAALGCKDSLVRYDLNCIGFARGVSNGYDVSALQDVLKNALGTTPETERKCCIVGLGRLGAALLDSSFFEEAGFTLAAGFDSNVNRMEILRSVFPLYPAFRIESVLPELKIEYAALAVEKKDAAVMTERLVRAGVKGIVNLTNSILVVPPEIKVANASLSWALHKII
ncbi:MAG: winged-helix domain-containing protein [Treponema sp.]